MTLSSQAITCILFDLDGTLADSAPDLVGALYQLCDEDKQQRPEFSIARNCASDGAMALISLAFQAPADGQKLPSRLARFLTIYRKRISQKTVLFDGIETLLSTLHSRAYPWGIVTNKPTRFTQPLTEALNLSQHSVCTISGDTTPHSKPHPEPMLLAATQAGVEPSQCLYVGDAQRDIQAGKAAGMKTAIAMWGYIKPDDDTLSWGADLVLNAPQDLTQIL